MKLDEVFLNEKIINIDDDVDRIYNAFFKDTIDAVESRDPKQIEASIAKNSITTTTGDLIKKGIIQNDILLELHLRRPLMVYINLNGNKYIPIENIISFSVNMNAFDVLINSMGGDLDNSWMLGSAKSTIFESEFLPERIKGSIHHELAHWHDDVMNNSHLRRKALRYRRSGKDSDMFHGKTVDVITDYEIEAQIHSIHQYYLNNKDIWDLLTFDQLVKRSSMLTAIKITTTPEEYKYWKRKILTRMSKEGFIGKNMRKGI